MRMDVWTGQSVEQLFDFTERRDGKRTAVNRKIFLALYSYAARTRLLLSSSEPRDRYSPRGSLLIAAP